MEEKNRLVLNSEAAEEVERRVWSSKDVSLVCFPSVVSRAQWDVYIAVVVNKDQAPLHSLGKRSVQGQIDLVRETQGEKNNQPPSGRRVFAFKFQINIKQEQNPLRDIPLKQIWQKTKGSFLGDTLLQVPV